MAAADPLNIYDFEALARSRIDPAAYDYFAGGAGDELTVAQNCRAFQRLAFRPRVLVNVSVVDPSTNVLAVSSAFL
jgi:isopentenyl diphosphate isomerase/L-lactate dehydrogenase-like FMN-dependent dehydrogenase